MSYIGNEPVISATRTVTEISATAGQTTFTVNGGYTVGYIDVFVNGSQLQTSDFTATNGTSVTLNAAAIAGDDIRLVAWGTFSIGSNQTSEFADGSASAPSITNSGDTNTGMFFPAADTIAFTEGGVESMRIDASGNVGIGTSSPTQKLSVSGGIAATGQFVPSNGATVLGYIGNDNSISGGTGTNLGIRSDTATTFATGGATERMRIDSSGNVGIGTSTLAFDTGSGLRIQRANAPATIRLVQDGSGGSGFELSAANSNAQLDYRTGALLFLSAGTERMRIGPSGQLGIGGANYGSSGQILTSQGSGSAPTWSTPSSGGGQLQDALYLSGTSTWTAPTGVTRVRVTVIGGGGAGGAGGNNGSDGAPGGVGGLAIGSYTVTPGTGYTVTVGGGGSRSGGSGGTSSFGGFLSATGGGGGQGNGGSSGGNGNGSGGTIRNRNIGFNSGSPWSGESTQWNIATQSFSIGSQYGAGQNGGGGPVFDGSGQPGGGGIGGLVYIQWVGS
jgi:hypothetical protein